MSVMRIFTAESKDEQAFNVIKKSKWTTWKLLISGEYSDSPFHFGKLSFYFAETEDKRFSAILYKGTILPFKRIVAVAEVIDTSQKEIIAGAMMRQIREELGLYITYPEDINIKKYDLFKEYYSGDKQIKAGNENDYIYLKKIEKSTRERKVTEYPLPNIYDERKLSDFLANFTSAARSRKNDFVLASLRLTGVEPDEKLDELHQVFYFYQNFEQWLHDLTTKIGKERAIPQLIKVLESTKVPDIKSDLAKFLERYADEKEVENLFLRLLMDCDEHIFRISADALGKIRSKKAITPLRNLLQYQKSYIRRVAVKTLAEIDVELSIQDIVLRFNDKDISVRNYAYHALIPVNSDLLIPNLRQISKTRSDHVRQLIYKLLEKNGKFGIEFLIGFLGSSNKIERDFGIYGLVYLGPATEQYIIEEFVNENPLTRCSAIKVLTLIDSDRAPSQISACLSNDKDLTVQLEAVRAITAIGNNHSVKALITAIENGNKAIIKNATQALAMIGSREQIKSFDYKIFSILLKFAEETAAESVNTAKQALKNHSDIWSSNPEMLDLLLNSKFPEMALSNFIKISVPPFNVFNVFNEIIKHTSICRQAARNIVKLGVGDHLNEFFKYAAVAAAKEYYEAEPGSKSEALKVLRRISAVFPTLIKDEIDNKKLLKLLKISV